MMQKTSMLKNIFIINILMRSQETINFVEDIINYVLTKWDAMQFDMRRRVRYELMSVFISFVGENNITLYNYRNTPLLIFSLNN